MPHSGRPPGAGAIFGVGMDRAGHTSMTILLDSTREPAMTALRPVAHSRSTGADSPVIADSSTMATPSITVPSHGITQPGSITTMSPLASAEAGLVRPSNSVATVSTCGPRGISGCALRRCPVNSLPIRTIGGSASRCEVSSVYGAAVGANNGQFLRAAEQPRAAWDEGPPERSRCDGSGRVGRRVLLRHCRDDRGAVADRGRLARTPRSRRFRRARMRPRRRCTRGRDRSASARSRGNTSSLPDRITSMA